MKTALKTAHAWPSRFAAALVALLSMSVSNGPSFAADDESDGAHDGYEDVQKDAKDEPIYAKDESGKGLTERNCKSRITAIFNAGRFSTADEERFFSEFFDVKIGELTWKQNAEELPDVRGKLRRNIGLAGGAPSPEVHDRLNAILLAKCKKIVADQRFPVTVRVNAMLMIGDLNQQEKRAGETASIVPLPDARVFLLASADDRSMHEALRIAATVGLKRHAQTNPTADVRKALKDAMLQILSKREPVEIKKKLGVNWLRKNAAEVLGVLATKGDEARQPDVSKEILAMAADQEVELWMRCEVAGNLGELDSKSFPADKIMPAARQLADLAVEISAMANKIPGMKVVNVKPAAVADAKKSEEKESKKSDKKSADKKPDKKSAEKKSDKKNTDKKNEPPAAAAAPTVRVTQHVRKVTSEELTSCLCMVRYALTGHIPPKFPVKRNDEAAAGGLLAAATDANSKSFTHELVAKVDKMLEITSGNKLEFPELVEQLNVARTELEEWLKNAMPGKPAGAPAVPAGIGNGE
jgi:hypothetical protein